MVIPDLNSTPPDDQIEEQDAGVDDQMEEQDVGGDATGTHVLLNYELL
jgi:hypothetical protein